jgi:hypothetical protein
VYCNCDNKVLVGLFKSTALLAFLLASRVFVGGFDVVVVVVRTVTSIVLLLRNGPPLLGFKVMDSAFIFLLLFLCQPFEGTQTAKRPPQSSATAAAIYNKRHQ